MNFVPQKLLEERAPIELQRQPAKHWIGDDEGLLIHPSLFLTHTYTQSLSLSLPLSLSLSHTHKVPTLSPSISLTNTHRYTQIHTDTHKNTVPFSLSLSLSLTHTQKRTNTVPLSLYHPCLQMSPPPPVPPTTKGWPQTFFSIKFHRIISNQYTFLM